MAEHNDLGKLGEKIACDYLVERGYQIVCKNYRWGRGELDIVSINPTGKYVFFEVKTRKGGGEPEQAVTDKKVKLLLETMKHYKLENKIEEEVFLDILAIVVLRDGSPKVEHFQDIWLY